MRASPGKRARCRVEALRHQRLAAGINDRVARRRRPGVGGGNPAGHAAVEGDEPQPVARGLPVPGQEHHLAAAIHERRPAMRSFLGGGIDGRDRRNRAVGAPSQQPAVGARREDDVAGRVPRAAARRGSLGEIGDCPGVEIDRAQAPRGEEPQAPAVGRPERQGGQGAAGQRASRAGPQVLEPQLDVAAPRRRECHAAAIRCQCESKGVVGPCADCQFRGWHPRRTQRRGRRGRAFAPVTNGGNAERGQSGGQGDEPGNPSHPNLRWFRFSAFAA
jgi:hypothetical protein